MTFYIRLSRMYWKPLLSLFWVLSLYIGYLHPALGQKSKDPFADLRKVQTQLDHISADFTKTAIKNPTNKGARKLANTLNDVMAGMGKYMNKRISRDSLALLTNQALAEASKYDTPKGKNLSAELKKVKTILLTLPAHTQTTAKTNKGNHSAEDDKIVSSTRKRLNKDDTSEESTTEEENTESQDGENADSAAQEVKIEQIPDSTHKTTELQNAEAGSSSATATWIYIVLGILLFVMLALGYYLYALIRSGYTELRRDLNANAEEHESIRAIVPTTATEGGLARLISVEGKMRNLENNAIDFFEQFEKRLNNIETVVKTGGNLPPTDTAMLLHDDKKISQLENRLRALESSLQNPLQSDALVGITFRYESGSADVMIEAVNSLMNHTDIPTLKNLCTDLKTMLQKSMNQQSWSGLDVYALGQLLQLAYVSMINEQQDEPYQMLNHALQKMGFHIYDNQIKTAALGANVAENIPYDQYLSNPKVKTAEYPNHKAINSSIEKNFDLLATQPNTVLCVLQPSITLNNKNGQTITIQKGKYVIR